jgi:hypothetical protein
MDKLRAALLHIRQKHVISEGGEEVGAKLISSVVTYRLYALRKFSFAYIWI